MNSYAGLCLHWSTNTNIIPNEAVLVYTTGNGQAGQGGDALPHIPAKCEAGCASAARGYKQDYSYPETSERQLYYPASSGAFQQVHGLGAQRD